MDQMNQLNQNKKIQLKNKNKPIKNEKDFDYYVDLIMMYYIFMEYEMMKSIVSMLKGYEDKDINLSWYTDMIQKKKELRKKTTQVIDEGKRNTDPLIDDMYKKSLLSNIDEERVDEAYEKGASEVPFSELLEGTERYKNDDAYKDIQETLKEAHRQAIVNAEDVYMDIINKSYMNVSNGLQTYDEAIKEAIKELVDNGITCMTYYDKNGRPRHYSLEGIVRRDIVTKVNQKANENVIDMCKQMGTNFVEVSAHLGARVDLDNDINNHMGWQGKIYQIDGDDRYPNLYETTGYGQLLGLCGVNCRHRMFPFFDGISVPYAKRPDTLENIRTYNATQQQRKLERQIRDLRKKQELYEYYGNTDLSNRYKRMISRKSMEIQSHCNRYGLRRDYERERIHSNEYKGVDYKATINIGN